MNTYEQGETVGTIAELMMELFLLDGYTSSSCVLCGRNKTINTQNVVKIFLSRYILPSLIKENFLYINHL